MWAVMWVCQHVCHTQAQSCLSTGWALNRCFAWFFGTTAVLAQGGGGVPVFGGIATTGFRQPTGRGTERGECPMIQLKHTKSSGSHLQLVESGLGLLESSGVVLVYAKGSWKEARRVGVPWIGGRGVYVPRRRCCTARTWSGTFFIFVEVLPLGDIHYMPTRSKCTLFRGFLKFWSNAPKFRFLQGVCVFFWKST